MTEEGKHRDTGTATSVMECAQGTVISVIPHNFIWAFIEAQVYFFYIVGWNAPNFHQVIRHAVVEGSGII